MKDKIAKDFESLSVTISSIYDLRGIGVSAAYVSKELWEYMVNQSLLPPFGSCWNCADQYFTEAEPKVSTTQDGKVERITIKPYGADRIPVKVKYSGGNPWKLVCGYKKKPDVCPRCGGEAEVVQPRPTEGVFVRCKWCGAFVTAFSTKSEAIAAWNRREK